ncbi:LamG domain-containing protein [Aeoliella sp. ICT_H6.2]|uniref:LamG domain-containing protein n=1 Tax=Aeoliella straminimaris TaxID=2954799 RepID=A0A9X2FA99_9BACT|nr:LamG domain-containing protein [Aeoliella straminimaris]MCO6045290.1 LamG domain-containing protein [Aeoliella straminimaris]
MISYWSLAEGSGTEAGDTAAGGAVADSGTLRESPAWINGMFNAGLQFTGTEDVLIPNSVDMDLGSDAVTLSAWVKLDKLPADLAGSYAGVLDSQSDSYVMYLDKGNNELRFKVTDANGTSTSAHPGIPAAMLDTTDWHHVMGVYDGTAGSVKIYYDGVLADIASMPTTVGTVRPGQVASLGSQPTTDAPHTASNFYEGGISDVALWTRSLGEAEAQYLFNGGTGNAVGVANPSIAAAAPLVPTQPTAQPVIYYAMDGDLTNQGTGGAALDGVFHDGPGMTGPQFAPTNHGQGLDLSANPEATASTEADADMGQYVSVDYNLPDQGTIELKFSSESSYNYQTVWANSVHSNAWESWVYGNERLAARGNNAANASNLDYLLTLVGGIGEDHHIAFTWERSGDIMEAGLYIDGVLREVSTENWMAPGSTFYLGGGPGNHLGKGIYDEFRIYDVPLTASEILYLAEVPEPGSLLMILLCIASTGVWYRHRSAS